MDDILSIFIIFEKNNDLLFRGLLFLLLLLLLIILYFFLDLKRNFGNFGRSKINFLDEILSETHEF